MNLCGFYNVLNISVVVGVVEVLGIEYEVIVEVLVIFELVDGCFDLIDEG